MDRCALCPNKNVCIPPDGPTNADILFVGEAPGPKEDEHARRHPPGQPFIGSTGKEVNTHYLPLAGLGRNRVRVTNAIRCLPTTNGGKLDPKRSADSALLESCSQQFLVPEILRGRYQVVVPMGAFACRALYPEINLEHQHGIPVDSAFGVLFPMYHPALGIYEPKKMLMIRNDWIRLKRFIDGSLLLPYDPYPNPDYREVTDVDEVDELDPTRPLGGDTESNRKGEPFCLTYSQSSGTGRLIRAGNLPVLQAFAKRVKDWTAPILFHFWLHDWPIVEGMGIRFPYARIVDTGAEAYRLGNLPQGLKTLAYRELGMEMQDFEDLVIPYSREFVTNYYRIAQLQEWERPDEELVIDEKTGLWKLYRPQSMSTKLKRFFTDLSKNPEGKDVFLTWENWEAHQVSIEEKCGPWPGMCISHVPFADTLQYACRDADALIRLWPIIRYMRSQVRKTGQENWRA